MLSLMVGMTLMAQGMVFEPEGTTLEQAAAKAKAENKLVFMDCYTQWCGPCKKMAKDVFTQEMVGAYMNPKFVNIKVDMESDYGTPLAKKLQITAYPTFVIFNGDAPFPVMPRDRFAQKRRAAFRHITVKGIFMRLILHRLVERPDHNAAQRQRYVADAHPV